jgi:hypothetical protein
MPDATITYQGNGELNAADYKDVKWVGKSKDGKPVIIEVYNAINRENLNFTFQEKNDSTLVATFEGCYENTDEAATTKTEPWKITISGQTSGASEILLGAGVFYIGQTPIALTRGGGSFTVEREYREINADGDRGPVKDRIEMVSAKPKLTFTALTWITKVIDIVPAIESTATPTSSASTPG